MSKKIKSIDPFIRLSDVADILSVNKSTIFRWVKNGRLPAPIRISQNVVCYRKSTIEKWMDEQQSSGRPDVEFK